MNDRKKVNLCTLSAPEVLLARFENVEKRCLLHMCTEEIFQVVNTMSEWRGISLYFMKAKLHLTRVVFKKYCSSAYVWP